MKNLHIYSSSLRHKSKKTIDRFDFECFLLRSFVRRALYFFENQIDSTRKSDYFLSFFSLFRDASLADLKYQEFPNEYAQSEIQVYVKKNSTPSQMLQRQFAWITGAGLYYTEIDPMNVQESFLKRSRILDYHFDQITRQRDEERPPKSVALTEFHSLMMFPNENQIRAICTVNEKVVMIDGSMAVRSKSENVRSRSFSSLCFFFSLVDRFVTLEIKFEINFGFVLTNAFFFTQFKMNFEMFGAFLCRKTNFQERWKLVPSYVVFFLLRFDFFRCFRSEIRSKHFVDNARSILNTPIFFSMRKSSSKFDHLNFRIRFFF
jgi:hypothetical protein